MLETTAAGAIAEFSLRKLAVFAGLLFAAATAAGAVVAYRVEGALAVVLAEPTLCLTPGDKARLERSRADRDRVVLHQVNAAMGQTRMLWWHLRGAANLAVYVTLRSPAERDEIFGRVASKMSDCPRSA